MNLIFVYGTLKRGNGNHRYLAGQTFVGGARSAAGYTLYDLAGFPGMVPQGDDLEGVCGEVWSVDNECLASLDVLECTGEGLYRREAVALGAPFSDQRIEAYIYLRSISGCRRIGPEWSE